MKGSVGLFMEAFLCVRCFSQSCLSQCWVHVVGLTSEELCISDRTVPSVNLWIAVPSSEVIIDNQSRTCEATNRASDLRVYLDFDSPVKSSTEDLLSLLSVSRGVLTTTARNSLGNRRFGFRVSSIRRFSISIHD